MQAYFSNNQTVLLKVYVFNRLCLSNKGNNIILSRSVLYHALSLYPYENAPMGLTDAEDVTRLITKLKGLSAKQNLSDVLGNNLYKAYMNMKIVSADPRDMRFICDQIVWSCSFANYHLLDKLHQIFDREESLCVRLCIHHCNVHAACVLFTKYGYVPTFETMESLIGMLNVKSVWIDFMVHLRSAILNAVHMGYLMEAVQFASILGNSTLRKDIAECVKMPFWYRFCRASSCRTNVVTKVPTADILSLAHNLSIDMDTLSDYDNVCNCIPIHHDTLYIHFTYT